MKPRERAEKIYEFLKPFENTRRKAARIENIRREIRYAMFDAYMDAASIVDYSAGLTGWREQAAETSKALREIAKRIYSESYKDG